MTTGCWPARRSRTAGLLVAAACWAATGWTGCWSCRSGRCTPSACASRSTSRSATRTGSCSASSGCGPTGSPASASGPARRSRRPRARSASGASVRATGSRSAEPSMATRTARLLVVATPIGNLGDLSARAAEALALADVVACEDTRRTGRLLAHLGIDAPKLVRLDDHTERDEVEGLLRRIRGGEVVALVSDAGTPGVSDPGARLITAAVDAGIPVEVVPGPVAAIVALV